MKNIVRILEQKKVFEYLQKKGLIEQYKKAKWFLLQGGALQVRFKQRNPKGSGVWSFRINKQYRAFCVFADDGDLIVFKIDDHQS